VQCTVALLQLASESDIIRSQKKGIVACRQAKEMGADIVLFPEMWSIGYEKSKMVSAFAIDQTSEYVQSFCALAKELEMAMVLTYLARGEKKPKNMAVVIDRSGTIILEYAKVHTCSFVDGTEVALAAGERFVTADLQLKGGSIRVGVMTCFDREFPESARILASQGAELIFVPNACDIKHDRELGDVRFCQLRARAFENMVGIVLANYPRPAHDGHSVALMPNGMPIVTADESEQVVIASFDIDALRSWRQKEVWGIKNIKTDIKYD